MTLSEAKMNTVKLAFLAASALLMGATAHAQTASLATVVAACGTPPNTYTAGQQRPITQNTSGLGCDANTLSGGTITTITNPVGVKGADGSTITSASNPLNVVITPSATAGLTHVKTSAGATNLLLKSGAGNLSNLTINIGATTGFLMLFPATSIPSNGAVTPDYCVRVVSDGTSGYAAFSFGNPGEPFATGILAAFSTGADCYTLAAATASFISGDVK